MALIASSITLHFTLIKTLLDPLKVYYTRTIGMINMSVHCKHVFYTTVKKIALQQLAKHDELKTTKPTIILKNISQIGLNIDLRSILKLLILNIYYHTGLIFVGKK